MRSGPMQAPRGAANTGGAGLADRGKSPLYELADVVTYDSSTHTATVRTHRGRPLQNLPQLKPGPNDFDHLTTGTTVVVFWGLGFPVIFGCLNLVGAAQSAIPSPTISGVEGIGADDPAQPANGTSSYRLPGAPTDMQQGDWARVGTLGNFVALLEGGVTSMGSPSAKVESLGPAGTLRTVARRLQQFTDFGALTIENDEGRTSLTLRAGASSTTQTGPDEQHWTIRLDLGATGDLLDLRITEPEGRLLFRLHAGADGRVQIYGDGGVDVSSGANGTGTMRSDIVGNHVVSVTGDVAHTTNGDKAEAVDGAMTASVGGDALHSVNGNHTTYVGGDHDVGSSNNATHVVGKKRKAVVGQDDETLVGGNASITATGVMTTDGAIIKHGAHAHEPVIKGQSFQQNVMTRLGEAGSTATTAAAAAQIAVGPDVVTGTPTAATITAVSTIVQALSQIGSLLTAAASAYATTLSPKVKTE